MEKGRQIYKLPEGWIWTTIGEIAVLSSGGTPSRANSNYFKGNIPWVKSGELNYNIITDTKEKITQEALETSSAKLVPANTLLIALYGSTVGKIARLGIEASTNQAVASIMTFSNFNQGFLYYYLFHNREKLLKKRKGGAQPNISQTILSNFILPLPPLREQNIIVYKIESLFSELDHAEKGLQKAEQQLKVYRQSLMKHAFEGKLTNSNIVQDNFPVEWKFSTLGNHGELISGQHILKNDYNFNNDGVPYFTGPSDFGESSPVITKWTTNPKVLVKKDDILITVKGSGLGKLNIVQEKSTIGRQLMAYNFNSGSKLYMYYFLLFQSQNLKALGIGSAIPGIDRESILNIACPIPSLKEQEQIVEILESRFTLIENLEKSINKSLNDVILFRHSVLKKAFEGKLVSQESKDETAKFLLQKIKKEKAECLKAQIELDKLKPKKKRKMETKKTVLEILTESEEPISTQVLWTNSIHDGDIEGFYSEIKEIYNKLTEIKKGTESLLSLKK